MKTTLLALTLAATAAAQSLNFNFDSIAAKAASKTEIKLDGAALQAAKESLAKNGKILPDVDAVSINAYEFAKPGDYKQADLEPLLKQVAADSRWSKMLTAREKDEVVDIYVMNNGGKLAGFLLIAAEPKEVAVIHILGSVQLAQLGELVNSSIKFDLKSLMEASAK